MKIALSNDVIFGYATGDPMAVGGAERAQWLLAGALAQTGWSVVIGVPKLPAAEEHVINGVRFVGMEAGDGTSPVSGNGSSLITAWARFLAAERPDWWYWRAPDPLWGALLLIAKTKGVRGIYACAFDTDVHPRIALTRRQWCWPLFALGLHAVERIFVQHSGQFSELSPRLQPKASIVPGVVVLRGGVKTYAERCKRVAWIGVLRQPKRPDLLIEMARNNPDLQFVVCGGTSRHRTPAGYGERMVRELQSLPNVEYLGHVSPDRAVEVTGDAIALLSTSDQEGLPNTFLEAWAAGTPVVSLKVDPGGVIKERGLGFVSGMVERAVSEVRGLLKSPEAFEAVSSRARKYVEEVHSDAAVVRVFNKAILGVS